MRALLAIFMVVLIGDPVCCCGIASSTLGTAKDDANLRPCCREHLRDPVPGDSAPGKEKLPVPCPCSKKLGVVSPAVPSIPLPQSVYWKTIFWTQGDPVTWRSRARAFQGPGKPPPGELSVESPPTRILFGVFRC